jgi:ATP synthase protein I
MMTYYGRVLRWSVPLTSVVAAVAVVICALLGGSKGAYGALVGVGVVAVFFAISILIVGRAAQATFLGKIVAFMIVLAVLRHVTAFSGRDLGFTALACILAWSASQVGVAMKLNIPYVEPDGQS